MPIETLALFFLATVAAGGVAWVFLYPLLSGERQAEKRMDSVAKPDRPTRAGAAAPQRVGPKIRREQVEESLKEMEERQKKAKNPPINIRLQQAGLGWSKNQFLLVSAAMGLAAGLAALFFGAGLLTVVGMAFAAGFGVPR